MFLIGIRYTTCVSRDHMRHPSEKTRRFPGKLFLILLSPEIAAVSYCIQAPTMTLMIADRALASWLRKICSVHFRGQNLLHSRNKHDHSLSLG